MKNQKRIKVRGKYYYQDAVGNLISADFVKENDGKIRTPKDILPWVSQEKTDDQENFIVITLDGGNQVIAKHLVTRGLANQSQVHPRETFKPAIRDGAVSVFIAHNHPSGNLEPSNSDLLATKRLVEVGKLVGIPVLDHVILSSLGFLSLREKHYELFI